MAFTHVLARGRTGAVTATLVALLVAGGCGGGDEPLDPTFDALCPAAQAAVDALAAAGDPTDPVVADAFAEVGRSAPPVAGSRSGSPDQLAFGLEQLYQSYLSVHFWHTASVDGPVGDVFGENGEVLDGAGTLARLDEDCSRVDVEGFEWRGAAELSPLPDGPAQLVRFLGVRMTCEGTQPAACRPDEQETDDHRAVGQVWCSGVGGSFRCAPFDPARYFGLGIEGVNHVCADPTGSSDDPSGDYRCVPWTGGAPPDPTAVPGALVCDGAAVDGAAGDGAADGSAGDGSVWPPTAC